MKGNLEKESKNLLKSVKLMTSENFSDVLLSLMSYMMASLCFPNARHTHVLSSGSEGADSQLMPSGQIKIRVYRRETAKRQQIVYFFVNMLKVLYRQIIHFTFADRT